MSSEGSVAARPRHKTVVALVVVGTIVAFLAVFAVWAKRQLLETDAWTETSTELLENKDVREQVSGFMVDELFTEADVQAQIQQALPPRAAPAAGPISGAIRQLATNLANDALQRPRVQQLWEQANEATHRTLLDVIQHGGDEDVKLDLSTIVSQLGGQVGVDAASKLPPGVGQIVILENNELESAQKAVDLLQTFAWALTALALVLYALAVFLAKGWRREALRSVGIGFILVGIAVLVIRHVAGDAVTGQLASTASAEPAVNATWSIGTSLLAAGGGAMLFYGIVIVIGTWLAGPTGLGRAARRALAPILHSRSTAYAALLIVLGLLFWWSPTPGFSRLSVSVLLVVLFVIGLEALRWQAIRDFPEQTWAAGVQRWERAAGSLLHRGGDGPSGRG
ncbi:MAG: hypothetical protein EXQ70_00520 [Solirubrobacterales bacterium]|nr:hypothetical protein [Solirubrobacterales bacterium]